MRWSWWSHKWQRWLNGTRLGGMKNFPEKIVHCLGWCHSSWPRAQLLTPELSLGDGYGAPEMNGFHNHPYLVMCFNGGTYPPWNEGSQFTNLKVKPVGVDKMLGAMLVYRSIVEQFFLTAKIEGNEWCVATIFWWTGKLGGNALLGGGFKHFLFSHPEPWGKWSNLTSIFFGWVAQPPTRTFSWFFWRFGLFSRENLLASGSVYGKSPQANSKDFHLPISKCLVYLEDHPRTCKWLIAMVIVSPVSGIIPVINGLNGL